MVLIDPSHIRVGMCVVGVDGQTVGVVKAVDAVASLIDRPCQRDIFIPHFAVPEVAEDMVRLAIPADRVDDMGWPMPCVLR
jgi:hypothetical protein